MDRRTAFATLYATDERGAHVPVDATICTLSLSRRTGGDIKTLKGVVPTNSMVDLKRTRMLNLVPVADKGMRRGTEHHVHLCLLLAINGEPIH